MTREQPVPFVSSCCNDSPSLTASGTSVIRNTPVQYCIVDGQPTVVHRKGLQNSAPAVFRALRRMATRQGLCLQEDRRERFRSVIQNRRRTLPVVALVSLALGSATAAASGPNSTVPRRVATVPSQSMDDVVVTAKRVDPSSLGRQYKVDAGKRFVTDPYGDAQAIRAVANVVRDAGRQHEVSTRGMVLPQTVAGGYIHRYDFTFPARCGGGTFSYYQTDGFTALGFHVKHKVILDAMTAGAFAGPRLWGPYDQVLGAKVDMEMLFGNGEQDGMGFLKAAYYIGRTPVMTDRQYLGLGRNYARHVRAAAACLLGQHQNFAAGKLRVPEVAVVP